jgi:hypothetical protein
MQRSKYLYIIFISFGKSHIFWLEVGLATPSSGQCGGSIMSLTLLNASQWFNRPKPAAAVSSGVPDWLRMAAISLRTILIALLVIMILHLSLPADSTVSAALESPTDLALIFLGLVASAWIALQIFIMPKDADAYRTWFYLGLAAVPFLLICMIGIW